jgi:penicillin amidase
VNFGCLGLFASLIFHTSKKIITCLWKCPVELDHYTPAGPERMQERSETIRIRGGGEETFVVKTSRFGPVLPEPLLSRPVAVRWTALDPSATNLNLLDLDRAASVEDALNLFNQAGTPPMNALVADRQGHIGWTQTGRLPVRVGFDGFAARAWEDGAKRWEGYVKPQDLPRQIDPPSGFLANANNKMVAADYPYQIAHGYENGWRASRISARLQHMEQATEADMLTLQLDTQAAFYRYDQALALRALAALWQPLTPNRQALRDVLQAWDGLAEPGSEGLALLVEFDRALAKTVLTPFFAASRAIDPQFRYGWSMQEVPLRQILDARPPALLPKGYTDWDALVVALLEQSADELLQRHAAKTLQELVWGRVNPVKIDHPLGDSIPLLGTWLNMPKAPLAGCAYCVRWTVPHGGAAERLVVAPNDLPQGILHMPGGQSGHPLSPFYRDQQAAWLAGRPLPLLSGTTRYRLILEPGGESR